jgi:hypothetical protein
MSKEVERVMDKKTKIWSVGEGISVVHIQDETLYMKIRDTLKLRRQKKWTPAVYMKEGIIYAWDLHLDKKQLDTAKEIIKKHK